MRQKSSFRRGWAWCAIVMVGLVGAGLGAMRANAATKNYSLVTVADDSGSSVTYWGDTQTTISSGGSTLTISGDLIVTGPADHCGETNWSLVPTYAQCATMCSTLGGPGQCYGSVISWELSGE